PLHHHGPPRPRPHRGRLHAQGTPGKSRPQRGACARGDCVRRIAPKGRSAPLDPALDLDLDLEAFKSAPPPVAAHLAATLSPYPEPFPFRRRITRDLVQPNRAQSSPCSHGPELSW